MQRPAFLNAWCLLKLVIWWLFCPAYFCRPLPSVLDLVPYSLAHSWQTGIPTQYLVLPWALQILSYSLEADPLLRLDSLGLGVLELALLFSPMFSPLPCCQLFPGLPLSWRLPIHFHFLCFPPVFSSTIGFTADNQHLNVNYFIWPFVGREIEIRVLETFKVKQEERERPTSNKEVGRQRKQKLWTWKAIWQSVTNLLPQPSSSGHSEPAKFCLVPLFLCTSVFIHLVLQFLSLITNLVPVVL